MEKPIKMDDLGVPLFLETPSWDHPHLEGERVPYLGDENNHHARTRIQTCP